MKLSWLTWVFILGVVIVVFFAFNNESGKNTVPLDELFPQEETFPVDVEYEYVDAEPLNETVEKQAPVVKEVVGVVDQVKEVVVEVPVVEKKVEKPAAVVLPVAKTESHLPDYNFTVQVASFKEKSRADKFADTMRAKGYDPFIKAKDLGAKGTWYRIYAGQFLNKNEADVFLRKVQADYQGSFLISPKK